MVVQDEIQRLGPSVDAMSKDGVMEAVLGQVCRSSMYRSQSYAMHQDALSVLLGDPPSVVPLCEHHKPENPLCGCSATMFTAGCSEM